MAGGLDYLKLIEEIDWSMFVLGQIRDQQAAQKPRHPLEIMVDNATGFKIDQDRELITTILYHMKNIVRNKKKMNKDFATEHETVNAEKTIAELKAILKSMPASKAASK